MMGTLGSGEQLRERADLLVIGGGTVGLPFALECAKRGTGRVLCLESGATAQEAPTHPLNRVEQLGHHYEGAEHGRFRGPGGTSARWGGALIPFQSADLHGAGWPLAMADLEPHLPQVEALFGLAPGPYHDPALAPDPGDYIARFAKWPPFAKRNTALLLAGALRTNPALDVIAGATVTRIALRDGGVLVEARGEGGSTIEVEAAQLVIAAGAVETTRLALMLDREEGGAISDASPALGRYFSDHLSLPFANLAVKDLAALNRLAGFRFGPGGTMRNLRFELAPAAAARAQLPPHFVHVGFEDAPACGFDALRDIYRSLQRGRIPAAGALAGLVRHAPWLARAGWWRFAEQRLLYPAGARPVLHLVLEQIPQAQSRITLSNSETDCFDSPLAAIDWRIGEDDLANMQAAAEHFAIAWRGSSLEDLGEITPFPADRLAVEALASGGIFHPTGSTRMGASAAEGVVDRDLRLFAAPQVRLLSTSVLPTGGGANPTMMLLLLALRCAAQLAP